MSAPLIALAIYVAAVIVLAPPVALITKWLVDWAWGPK